MKKLFTCLFIAVSASLMAQQNVGIGTTQPDNSAILDLSSSNKGFLMPRMTEAQRMDIKFPAQGLQVFQTDATAGVYVFDGLKWLNSTSSVSLLTDPWVLGGNNISSDPNATIGTTSPHDLKFKVNNNNFGYLNSSKEGIYLGRDAGLAVPTGVNNIGIGTNVLKATTSGWGNVGLGYFNLEANQAGAGNLAIGGSAMRYSVSGNYNVAIGLNAGLNLNNDNNTVIGRDALRTNTAGTYNVAIGYLAGRNATGSSSVFMGYGAGLGETTSNKLYIANSGTATPLIYGDFSAKFIAIGDVTASPAKRDNLAAQYGLLVQKGILTEKIKVATLASGDWADYVFEDDYKMLTLDQVESFIKDNKHLPNVPTTEEMMANGNDLQKTDAKLLEKIEELTIYMIEMNKEIKSLQAKNELLKKTLK